MCVCDVCVRMIHDTASLSWRVRMMHPNSGGRTPGSKLPASPPPLPALMAGEPLAVYLCTRPYQLTQPTNRYVEHLVNELQLENLYGQLNSLDHGKPTLRHDKDNTNCNCGSTNDSPQRHLNQHDEHSRDIDHHVQQLGNASDPTNSQDHGICLCATTG